MKIVLIKTQKGWMAEYFGKDAYVEKIINLFGTHILPTAFTAAAPAHQVLSAIQQLNPTADVWLDNERNFDFGGRR